MSGKKWLEAGRRFLTVMLPCVLVMFLLFMWSGDWDWNQWRQSAHATLVLGGLLACYVIYGILRGFASPSNGDFPFSRLFRFFLNFPKQLNGWQRIIVVASSFVALCLLLFFLYKGGNVSFWGGVAFVFIAFFTLSSLSLFLLWLFRLLYRWVKAGFDQTPS